MPSISDIADQPRPFFKTLVLGDAGAGKSVFAASFPKPMFVFDLDKGISIYVDEGGDIDFEQFEMSGAGWIALEAFKGQFISTHQKALHYKTVIIDSTTTMMDMAMERAIQMSPKLINGCPIWNVHFSIQKNLMQNVLRPIIDLDANIVIIGHLIGDKDETTGQKFITPLLPGNLSERLPTSFGEVLYAQTRTDKTGTSQFVLLTANKGYFKARSRLSGKARRLPEYVPNNYKAIMEILETKNGSCILQS